MMIRKFKLGKKYGEGGYRWGGIEQYRFSYIRKEQICEYCKNKINKGELAYIEHIVSGKWESFYYHINHLEDDPEFFIIFEFIEKDSTLLIINKKGETIKEIKPKERNINEIIDIVFNKINVRKILEENDISFICKIIMMELEDYNKYKDYDVVCDDNNIYIYDDNDNLVKTINLEILKNFDKEVQVC